VLAVAAVAVAAGAAPAGASDHLMRVKEIAVSQGSDSTRQFLELEDDGNEPFPAPPYKVVVFEDDGDELGEQTLSAPTIAAAATGQPVLLASAAWQTANPTPDETETLTVTLPQGAGQVCFTRGDTEQRIDCMTYGCIASERTSESGGANGAVPPDGQSAQRDQFDVVTLGAPTPKAANTAGTAAPACPPEPPGPPTFVTAPNQGETVANKNVSFYWVGAEPGTEFECSVNGGAFSDCSPPADMANQDDGPASFAVRQIVDGVEGDPVTRNFTIDVIGTFADITISDDDFTPDGATQSGATRKPLGSSFIWKWGTNAAGTTNFHNVRQNKNLFASGDTATSSPPFSTTPSAGSFPYFCTVHSGLGMTGTVEVIPIRDPLNEPDGLPFRIAWDDPGTTTTASKFDVRYRVNGGKLKTWLDDTKKPGAVFGKNDRPVRLKQSAVYEFQVRSQKGRRAKSGFSPMLPVRP
jgi:hypothetical protein